jgi:alpha-galactosidase
MLVVGLVGWGPKLHYTKLTADEQYTHMSLWALFASPLLIGCDMARMDDFTLSLLSNDEVIEVNQDPLGLHAVPVWRKSDNSQVIYVKHLEDGSLAVGLFNKSNKPVKISINPRMLGLYDGTRTVRDLWRQKDVGHLTDDTGKGRFTTEVAPHGVALLKVYPGNSDKRYTNKVTYAK